MIERVEIDADPVALARAAAEHVAEQVRASAHARRRFSMALSGGSTPWPMLARLAELDLPWDLVDVFQVDERVAPAGDPDRNLTHLAEALPRQVAVVAMPVDLDERSDDSVLDAAAGRYAALLPARFDLVHLGIGPDGHTASLVPGDPVLDVADRDVAVTGEYQGRRRMTLTYPVLDRAVEVMWLVAGADKADALDRVRAEDPSIPAGRVRTLHQVLFADAAAARA